MQNNIFYSEGGLVNGTIGTNIYDNPQIKINGLGNITYSNKSVIKKLGIEEIDVSTAGVQ